MLPEIGTRHRLGVCRRPPSPCSRPRLPDERRHRHGDPRCGAAAGSPAGSASGRWSRPIVLVLIVGLLPVPVANIVGVSLSAGAKTGSIFENYVNFFSERFYYQTLISSFWVSIWATMFAVCLGVPAAYFLSIATRSGAAASVRAAVVLTFVSPPLHRFLIPGSSCSGAQRRPDPVLRFDRRLAALDLRGLGDHLRLHAAVLPLRLPARLLGPEVDRPRSVEDAARNLGSSEFRTFRTAIAPLLVPSITTSALLVFIASATDLGTPIILGERLRVLPVLIYGEFVNEFGGRPVLASALSVLLLSVTTGALLPQRWLSARFSYATSASPPAAVQGTAAGQAHRRDGLRLPADWLRAPAAGETSSSRHSCSRTGRT